MTAPGNVNSSPFGKVDFLAQARETFGDALPDWIEEAAKLATQTTAAHAARRIGYSASVITTIFRGAYNGDLAAVEAKVRGALMGLTVECPVIGEIAKDICLNEQKKKHIGTSATRTALFHACRGGCPHSLIKTSANASSAGREGGVDG